MAKKELANIDIILYALYLLGGTAEKIPTENITLKCFRLAPSRFCWILHPKYPDMETVRRALIEARSIKRGGLVFGRHGRTKEDQVSDGWILSPAGIAWVEKSKSYIENLLGKKQKPVTRTKIDKRINELENSVAFKKFLKDKGCQNILPYEFTDFLNANLDTPSSILRDRVNQIRAIAKQAKREKIIDFVDKSEKYFLIL